MACVPVTEVLAVSAAMSQRCQSITLTKMASGMIPLSRQLGSLVQRMTDPMKMALRISGDSLQR